MQYYDVADFLIETTTTLARVQTINFISEKRNINRG